MENDVLTRNENEELAVRVVSATEQTTVVNPDDVYTRDTDGNLAIRVVGQGGGGDSHNKGYYATPEDLQEALPTAEAGDYAIVETTDTIWIWDTDTNTWKDSDQKGQVSSVNNKTGAVVLDAKDVSAVPQYEEVPTTTSADVGKIFQFAGEYDTKTGYCQNGQFYKVSNEQAFRISIEQTVGTDLGIRFESFYAFGFCVNDWFNGGTPSVDTFIYNGTEGAWYYTPEGEEPSEIELEDLGLVCDGTPVDGDTFILTGYNESYPCENIRVEEKEIPDYNGLSGTRYLIANSGSLYWTPLDAITNESNKTGTISLLTGSTIGTGTNSTVIGVNAVGTTNGNNTAIGSNASALNNSVAIGCNVSATGVECITIGYNAYNTSSSYSIMMGRNANATGGYCIGIGNSSTTSYGGTAVGYSSQAKYYSVAMGQYAKAPNNGIAIGSYQTAGAYSISIGSASNGFSTNSNVVAVCAGEQGFSNAGTIAQGCIVLSTVNRTTTNFFDNLTQNSMYVGLNSSLYMLVDSSGNIPVNRIASTTGLADGVYVLKMTIVDGVKTLSWVLES